MVVALLGAALGSTMAAGAGLTLASPAGVAPAFRGGREAERRIRAGTVPGCVLAEARAEKDARETDALMGCFTPMHQCTGAFLHW